jgi:hypothetical protein
MSLSIFTKKSSVQNLDSKSSASVNSPSSYNKKDTSLESRRIGFAFENRFQQEVKKRRLTKPYQHFGIWLAQNLGDTKNIPLFIRLAKNQDRILLESAVSYVKDYPNARSRTHLFLWFLKGKMKSSSKEEVVSSKKGKRYEVRGKEGQIVIPSEIRNEMKDVVQGSPNHSLQSGSGQADSSLLPRDIGSKRYEESDVSSVAFAKEDSSTSLRSAQNDNVKRDFAKNKKVELFGKKFEALKLRKTLEVEKTIEQFFAKEKVEDEKQILNPKEYLFEKLSKTRKFEEKLEKNFYLNIFKFDMFSQDFNLAIDVIDERDTSLTKKTYFDSKKRFALQNNMKYMLIDAAEVTANYTKVLRRLT